jgi:hypothetical protein
MSYKIGAGADCPVSQPKAPKSPALSVSLLEDRKEPLEELMSQPWPRSRTYEKTFAFFSHCNYFQTRLQAMSEFNFPIVHQIQDALVEVKPLINIGNACISAELVKKVNEITTRLGNEIIKKD